MYQTMIIATSKILQTCMFSTAASMHEIDGTVGYPCVQDDGSPFPHPPLIRLASPPL